MYESDNVTNQLLTHLAIDSKGVPGTVRETDTS